MRVPYKDPERQKNYYKNWASANLPKINAKNKAWNKANPDRIRKIWRRATLKAKYGLSLEEYDRLCKEQRGVCAICNQPEKPGKRLVVDHNHKTGQQRGLLCNLCNSGLGYFRENLGFLSAAQIYLRHFQQRTIVTSERDAVWAERSASANPRRATGKTPDSPAIPVASGAAERAAGPGGGGGP